MFSSAIVPYFYAIASTFFLLTFQFLFKMIAMVMNPMQIIDFRGFALLALNTFILTRSIPNHRKIRTSNRIQNRNPVVNSFGQQFSLQIKQKQSNLFQDLIKKIILVSFFCFVHKSGSQICSFINSQRITQHYLALLHQLLCFSNLFFYRKKIYWFHIVLTFISFYGVLMIVNPFQPKTDCKFPSQQQSLPEDLISHYHHSYYIFYPVLAAFTTAMALINLHELKGRVKRKVIMQYSYIFQTIFASLLLNFFDTSKQIVIVPQHAFFQPKLKDPYFIGVFFLMIIASYAGEYFRVVAAFQLSPSKIAPFNYLGIVLGLVFDLVVFGHKTHFYQIIGIILTSFGLFSQMILSIQKRLSHVSHASHASHASHDSLTKQFQAIQRM